MSSVAGTRRQGGVDEHVPVSADANGPASDAPRSAAAVQRSRDVWRPVVLSAALVLALLGLFAYVLATAQANSRHEAEQRFATQATVAAGLTSAIISATTAPATQMDTAAFSGPIRSSQLAAAARRAGVSILFITDANGRVLAATGGPAAARLVTLPQPRMAIERAAAGTAFFSDVFDLAGKPMVVEAIPFPTASGRRIEVGVLPVTALFGFLSSYLGGAIPSEQTQTHGFIVDGAGRIIGSSVSGVRPGQLPSGSLQGVLSSAPSGGYHGSKGPRFVAAAPIGRSAWRVAITEPVDELYPTLVGSHWWVLWSVFVAFAFASFGFVYLLKRTLSGAAVVAEQARELEQTNAALVSANAELDAFSYSVSHDLRAPLRAIDGFSRIVVEEDDGALGESQRRYLGLVRENTRTMGMLIDELLALSRVSSQPLERRSVSTESVVRDLVRELESDGDGREVHFAIGELPTVQADPGLLRQVFANLMGNAVKYTRSRARAEIEVDSEILDGERVFRVGDNGVGFDMRYADKLFDVFQRLHRAEDYEGTGVGLAIVARIVARHGGRAWAHAAPDEGATFFFTLGQGGT